MSNEHERMAAQFRTLIDTPMTINDLQTNPDRPMRYNISVRTANEEEKGKQCIFDGCTNVVGDMAMECFLCNDVRPFCINHMGKVAHDVITTNQVEDALCMDCKINARLVNRVRSKTGSYSSSSDGDTRCRTQ